MVIAMNLKQVKPTKKFIVRVTWKMSAEVEVSANNKRDAILAAIDAPLPSSSEWEYVPSSAFVYKTDIHQLVES